MNPSFSENTISILSGDCLPLLIGSQPLGDHVRAAEFIFEYTPEIPVWGQLPVYREEGMVAQFLPGMPGLSVEADTSYIDMKRSDFDDELVQFYEDYMAVTEDRLDINQSRFSLKPDTAMGFFVFLEKLKSNRDALIAVKGQVTGPVTFGTGVKDQNQRSIFYNEQLRDTAVKLLAQKAVFQVRKLSSFKRPVIIFIDEPALAGFGSSEFISISREEIIACLDEVIEGIHSMGGLAGIHVCANTDWSMILETSVDIVNFDAYSYFDRFVLYPDQIKKHFDAGKIVAWGIIPTVNAEDIKKETSKSLAARWEEYAKELEKMGIGRSVIKKQSLITPSCGTGSVHLDLAEKVLKLTKDVSRTLRNS